MPKSSKTKNTSSRHSNDELLPNNLSRPFTPLRRFFFKLELLGTSAASVPSFLGKRRREELPERKAGFEHLHAYDHGVTVSAALEGERSGNAGDASAAPINVYSPDGTRRWTKRPTGPRTQKQSSAGPSRRESESESLPMAPYSTPRPSYRARREGKARVALQNIDTSLDDDAVIITALDNIPFTRHEDLLVMSRSELVNVARNLNAKLPLAMAIDTSDERPLAFIRNAIEVLVGIRPEVPAAPLRVGKMKVRERDHPRFFEEFSFEKQLEELDEQSPLHTPLSCRTKLGDLSCLHDVLRVPRQLESLREENEEEQDGTYGRKRRRLSAGTETTLETDPDVVMHSASEGSFTNSDASFTQQDTGTTPTLVQSHHTPRVLRSHTRRLQKHVDNATLGVLAPKLPKRTYKVKRSVGARNKSGHRSSSGSSAESSTNDQRNSIAFPTIKSSSIILHRRPSSKSNASSRATDSIYASTNSTDDSLLPSTAGSPPQPREHSNGETDSLFLSIRSGFSSRSGMSVCTRSTGSYAQDGTFGVPSGEENAGLMDLSL